VYLDVGKKTDKVAEDWTAEGNEFQMTDAATGNERRPTVIYLLNTQLVQDIIKTCIHTEMRKKDIKHSGKKHTHIKTL